MSVRCESSQQEGWDGNPKSNCANCGVSRGHDPTRIDASHSPRSSDRLRRSALFLPRNSTTHQDRVDFPIFMAPARQPDQASFAKDERVLCFHHEMLYEAKVLDIQPPETENDVYQYRVHYKGWKNTWDDWVAPDRIRKFTESNKELAAQLHAQMKNLQKSTSKVPKKGLRPNGTDSARGSEERSASLFATGRGPRRTRDYELETTKGSASFKREESPGGTLY
ncbi:Chromatin modification-related protein eaf3 like [Verticillium longisporum]|nr:Chromatin modification-related protein eaf3 like [Verticillium longisporum]